MTIDIPSFTSEHSEYTRMYRTITKCDFQQVFNRNLSNRVPVNRILNIDRTLKNKPNYNQHLNGISFYYIIVTLKYNNFNLKLHSLYIYMYVYVYICIYTILRYMNIPQYKKIPSIFYFINYFHVYTSII